MIRMVEVSAAGGSPYINVEEAHQGGPGLLVVQCSTQDGQTTGPIHIRISVMDKRGTLPAKVVVVDPPEDDLWLNEA